MKLPTEKGDECISQFSVRHKLNTLGEETRVFKESRQGGLFKAGKKVKEVTKKKRWLSASQPCKKLPPQPRFLCSWEATRGSDKNKGWSCFRLLKQLRDVFLMSSFLLIVIMTAEVATMVSWSTTVMQSDNLKTICFLKSSECAHVLSPWADCS